MSATNLSILGSFKLNVFIAADKQTIKPVYQLNDHIDLRFNKNGLSLAIVQKFKMKYFKLSHNQQYQITRRPKVSSKFSTVDIFRRNFPQPHRDWARYFGIFEQSHTSIHCAYHQMSNYRI